MADEDGRRSENKAEQLDRELIELLNELRVALPGVQVLFAFLLIVPFQQGFQQVTTLQRNVYFSAVLTTTAATIMLIAPTAIHRIMWRARDKDWMLTFSNGLALAGTFFLALSTTAVIFLITDVLFSGAVVGVVVAVTAGLLLLFWFAIPLARRTRA